MNNLKLTAKHIECQSCKKPTKITVCCSITNHGLVTTGPICSERCLEIAVAEYAVKRFCENDWSANFLFKFCGVMETEIESAWKDAANGIQNE
jgi:hypothetical protein